MIPGEPTLSEVKEWLGVRDQVDDVTLNAGLQAALAWHALHLTFPAYTAETCGGNPELIDQAYYPDDLRLAVNMRTARWLARRNSPEGLVGFGEFGPAQVSFSDRDISDLEAGYSVPVIA